MNIPNKTILIRILIFISVIYFIFSWNALAGTLINQMYYTNEDLNKLRLKNGDIIPNIESYFSDLRIIKIFLML
jgi:hypothetical protein